MTKFALTTQTAQHVPHYFWCGQQEGEVPEYQPKPIDTLSISLPTELKQLTERLAENAHDQWAVQRMRDGWVLGDKRDDDKKTHPSLVPYADLSESEKDYDRTTAMETLKAIMALGFRIERN